MDGTFSKDQVSGRHLIEGRGVPIDGGIFISFDGTRTLVDFSSEKQPKLNAVVMDIVAKMKLSPALALNTVVQEAQKAIPINDANVKQAREDWKRDEFQLQMFLSNKREADDKELGGGNHDHQALLVALSIETYYKQQDWRWKTKKYLFGNTPKVATIKDKSDKHAIVTLMNSHDSVYRFDPKTDSKFVKL